MNELQRPNKYNKATLFKIQTN